MRFYGRAATTVRYVENSELQPNRQTAVWTI